MFSTFCSTANKTSEALYVPVQQPNTRAGSSSWSCRRMRPRAKLPSSLGTAATRDSPAQRDSAASRLPWAQGNRNPSASAAAVVNANTRPGSCFMPFKTIVANNIENKNKTALRIKIKHNFKIWWSTKELSRENMAIKLNKAIRNTNTWHFGWLARTLLL